MEQAGQITQQINETTAFLQKKLPTRPKTGLVLGSGLGTFVDHMKDQTVIPYEEIPHFHATTVAGHSGQMVFGYIDKVPVLALQGRWHFYEGHSMNSVVLPTRVICALGVQNIVLTNAAGGINESFQPGELMMIEDHINFMGDNPLIGKEPGEFGPRFPDMSDIYCRKYCDILREIAKSEKISIRSGVYVGVRGPTYETPAEIKMFRIWGGDAIGMSTVPEAIAAHHLGVRVTGISCVTNLAAGISGEPLDHADIQDVANRVIQQFSTLLHKAIPRFIESH